EAPVMVHQFAGQPIEQLGMAGGRALRPEVVVGLDQAAAEIHLPDPVDRHSGRQWVATVDQPLGQFHSVKRGGRTRALQGGKDRGNSWLDSISLAGEVASEMNVRPTRFTWSLGDNHC